MTCINFKPEFSPDFTVTFSDFFTDPFSLVDDEGIPTDNLVLFIEEVDGSMVDTIGGSELLWSTSGPVCDGEGGLTEDIPVHDEGLWVTPSYTRGVGQPTPAGYPEIPEGTTSASMAATSGGNGASIEMSTELLECFGGVKRELMLNGDCDNGSLPTINGEPLQLYGLDPLTISTEKAHSGSSCMKVVSNKANASVSFKTASGPACGLVIGKKYTQSIWVWLPSGQSMVQLSLSGRASSGANFPVGNSDFTQLTDQWVKLESSFIEDGSDRVGWLYANDSEIGEYWYADDMSICDYIPQPMTAIVGVTIGVGSADIITPINITTVDDSVSGLVFLDIGGTIKCSDGTNTATVTITGGYSAFDEIYAVPQVSADGTQMRIGYVKNDDTSVTWGSYVTYSGTFTPGDYFRFAFENTTVMWSKGLGQYDIALDDTNILKVAKELK